MVYEKKATEFRNFVHNKSLDAVLVKETHLGQGQEVKIANYENLTIYRPHSGSHGFRGGTAVYVEIGFNATFINIRQLNHVETTTVVLDFLHIPKLLIAATYIAPRLSTRRNLVEHDLTLITNNFSNFIRADDLNAHHPSWNNRYSHIVSALNIRWRADQNVAQIIRGPRTQVP